MEGKSMAKSPDTGLVGIRMKSMAEERIELVSLRTSIQNAFLFKRHIIICRGDGYLLSYDIGAKRLGELPCLGPCGIQSACLSTNRDISMLFLISKKGQVHIAVINELSSNDLESSHPGAEMLRNSNLKEKVLPQHLNRLQLKPISVVPLGSVQVDTCAYFPTTTSGVGSLIVVVDGRSVIAVGPTRTESGLSFKSEEILVLPDNVKISEMKTMEGLGGLIITRTKTGDCYILDVQHRTLRGVNTMNTPSNKLYFTSDWLFSFASNDLIVLAVENERLMRVCEIDLYLVYRHFKSKYLSNSVAQTAVQVQCSGILSENGQALVLLSDCAIAFDMENIVQISVNDHLSYSSEDIEANFICLRLPDSVSKWALVGAGESIVLRTKRQFAVYAEAQTKLYNLPTCPSQVPTPDIQPFPHTSTIESQYQPIQTPSSIAMSTPSPFQAHQQPPFQSILHRHNFSQSQTQSQIRGSVCITYVNPDENEESSSSSYEIPSELPSKSINEADGKMFGDQIQVSATVECYPHDIPLSISNRSDSQLSPKGDEMSGIIETPERNNTKHDKHTTSMRRRSESPFEAKQPRTLSPSHTSLHSSQTITQLTAEKQQSNKVYTPIACERDTNGRTSNEGSPMSPKVSGSVKIISPYDINRIIFPEKICEETQTDPGEIEKIETEYRELQKSIDECITDIEVKNADIISCQTTISEIEGAISETTDYRALADELETERKQIEGETLRIKQKAALREVRHQREIEACDLRIKTIQDKLEKMASRNEDLNKEFSTLQKKSVSEAEKSALTLEVENGEIQRQINELERKNNTEKASVIVLERECGEEVKEINRLNNTIDKTKRSISELDLQMEVGMKTISQIRERKAKQVKAIEDKMKRDEEYMRELSGECVILGEKLSKLEQEGEKLLKQIKDKENENNIIRIKSDVRLGYKEAEGLINSWKQLEKVVIEMGSSSETYEPLYLSTRHDISVLLNQFVTTLRAKQYL